MPASPTGTVSEYAALSPDQRAWITAADTFFVATHAAGLGADVSHRGGHPGFVSVTDEGRLTWPDYPGNSMYMTLGNLELEPRAGLLFLDWDRGRSFNSPAALPSTGTRSGPARCPARFDSSTSTWIGSCRSTARYCHTGQRRSTPG